MAMAWPAGVPEAELMIRARLDRGKAEKLARRLEEVVRYVEGQGDKRAPSASEAAKAAGLAISQFHALVAAWRRKRSLTSLGVHATRRGSVSRISTSDARARIVEQIRLLLVASPDMRPSQVRRAFNGVQPLQLSDASLLRLIAEARRLLPPGVFGRRLILDSAGLDFVDGEGLRIRLYGVVDHGTGLLLGWAVGTDRSKAMGHFWAAHDALGRLSGVNIQDLEVSATDPILDVRLHQDDSAARTAFGTAFEPAPSLGRASRTLGSTIVDVLGERIDDVWLGTGERPNGIAYRSGKQMQLPEYTSTIAWTIDPAIERHNARRLALAGAAASGSHQNASETHVRAALQRVTRLESTIRNLPDYAWVAEMEEGVV